MCCPGSQEAEWKVEGERSLESHALRRGHGPLGMVTSHFCVFQWHEEVGEGDSK